VRLDGVIHGGPGRWTPSGAEQSYSCAVGLRRQPGERRGGLRPGFSGDDHALHEEIPDAGNSIPQDEAGVVQEVGPSRAIEQGHLVG